MDIVGPSNLITLLDSIPAYWEAGKKMMFARMADPKTEAGKAWLKERSPLTSADKIKTPLMVVQGMNDPRVNRAEAEQIVIALRDRKFPVEYLMAPDEGHGFQRPVNNMAMFMAVEKFLSKHLDGRYQEGGTPEVTKRLAEITVDPATVKVTKKVDPNALQFPKVSGTLQPGTLRYQAKLTMGAQEVAIKVSSTVKEENGDWVVSESMESQMGVMTNESTLDKATLAIKKVKATQGPLAIGLTYEADKAVGKMSMNGQDQPISAPLTGPLFADGAGSMQSIAALPLVPGYTASFRNFDMQRQKEKLTRIEVSAMESITVPAGTFNCHKVDFASADGGGEKGTIWVDKETRKPTKMSFIMPQANGAVMTMELLP